MRGWFTGQDTYDREIKDPVSGDTATVTLRPLTWGMTLQQNEIKLEQTEEGGGRARMAPGDDKLLLVELALVDWTLTDDNGAKVPITRETIRKLNPLVGEQIHRHINVGEGPHFDPEAELEETDADRATGEAVVPLRERPREDARASSG